MEARNFAVSAFSDIGNVKKSNQDNILVRVGEDRTGEFGLFVVADGMGGLAYGGVASEIVTNNFNEWWNNELFELIENSNDDLDPIFIKQMKNITSKSNSDILSFSKKVGQKVGTTLSAIFIYNGKYYISHVGDSRIYVLNNQLKQLTKDHSWVAREVREGRISSEAARNHPKKNVLLHCLGVKEKFELMELNGETEVSDSFILCSDGFHNYLRSKEVYEAISKYKNGQYDDLNEITNEFLRLVKERGAKDNISGIVVCQWGKTIKKSVWKKLISGIKSER